MMAPSNDDNCYPTSVDPVSEAVAAPPSDVIAPTLVERMAGRLQALEAEGGVRATLRRYGHALDYGAEDDWVDCFAARAHYEVRQRGAETAAGTGPGGAGTAAVRSYDGRDELAAFAARHTRAPERFHKHL